MLFRLKFQNLSSRPDDIPLLNKIFSEKIAEINGIPEININVEEELLL